MTEKNRKFILDIVPLTKIPLTTHQSFSYLSETSLPAGTLVSIPLFHRKVEGIVLGARKDFPRLGNIELKNIEKNIEENFLTPKQIELAEYISRHYISPLGVVMKNFVPKRAKARKIKEPQRRPQIKKKVILTKEQKEAVNEISRIPAAKYLLFGPSGSGKTEVYIHSILKAREKNPDSQFLVLVPEKTLTSQAVERYAQYFKSDAIVLVTSGQSDGQFYANWQKIKSGEAKIIIGTRMAIFAPFKKLGLVVIDEEQDMSYKQWDMNPRYDARTAAEELARLHGCILVRGSATPSVESFYRVKEKDYKMVELPPLRLGQKSDATPKEPLPAEVVVVDMKKERWQKNFSCVSKKLRAEIAYALKNRQQAILLVNRQGMSAFSVCEACKTVLKCPKCERGLVYDKDGRYKCAHCSYATGIVPKCPSCGGLSFKNVGVGTQKVEREILSLFPSSRILVADTPSSKVKNFHDTIYQKFSRHEADILIGTQMVSKGWDLPRVSLVGIIDTDNLSSFPDFVAQEKAYQLIVQVSGRVNRPGAAFRGEVIIQSYRPENAIIRWAAEKNYASFYENESKERKDLGLPPFRRLIKLVYQDYDQKKVDLESEKIYSALTKGPSVKITAPHAPLLSNIRGRYRKQIVIKVAGKIPDNLAFRLQNLASGWIIDVDPISTA